MKRAQRKPVAAWLAPLSERAPCGPNLEYDNDFLVLQSHFEPVADVQYGDFTARRAGPDWADLELQCHALLARSRDIWLLVWLTRCRVRREGAVGLVEGLEMLATTLETWPEDLHPRGQRGDGDGDGDPDGFAQMVRANALAGLVDCEGLLADVRSVVLDDRPASRLSVRDVERALSPQRKADPQGLPAGQVVAWLNAARALSFSRAACDEGDEKIMSSAPIDEPMQALATAHEWTCRISRWSMEKLGEDAPSFSALEALLSHFRVDESAGAVPAPAGEQGSATELPIGPEPVKTREPRQGSVQPGTARTASTEPPQSIGSLCGELPGREEARALISEARFWFDTHEPSSPVGVLLRRAEYLVGKRYAEVALAIPSALLAEWEQAV